MTAEEYEDVILRLERATAAVKRARDLDAQGGPRRKNWARDERMSAYCWGHDIVKALGESLGERAAV